MGVTPINCGHQLGSVGDMKNWLLENMAETQKSHKAVPSQVKIQGEGMDLHF